MSFLKKCVGMLKNVNLYRYIFIQAFIERIIGIKIVQKLLDFLQKVIRLLLKLLDFLQKLTVFCLKITKIFGTFRKK